MTYDSILPDLFAEGEAAVVTGVVGSDGIMKASEVLAKHDENYTPPEVAESVKIPANISRLAKGWNMIPEYGNFALIIALTLAICLSVVPMAGSFTSRVLWMSAARPLAVGQFVFTTIAFCILTYCFVVGDFSVKYVATNSNSLLPTYYKVSAVWGGHEALFIMGSGVMCLDSRSGNFFLNSYRSMF